MSNMEAFNKIMSEIGKQLTEETITTIKAALEAKDEPVATDWERIARVQNAKLMAMLDEAGGFEKLCEVMDKYEALSPTPPQRKPLTDEEIHQIFIANSVAVDNGNAYMVAGLRAVNIARAIEAKLKEKNHA